MVFSLALAVGLVASVGGEGRPSAAAETSPGTVSVVFNGPAPAEFQDGQIVDKYASALALGGHTYPVAASALFADSRGAERQWSDFDKGDFVRFHLRAGQIDLLILEIPR
jgi:hypothetical protein